MDDDSPSGLYELIASLDEGDRRALVRLFGALYDPRELPSPQLCEALRDIGTLDDAKMVLLAQWFQNNVNMWGVVVGDAASRDRVRFPSGAISPRRRSASLIRSASIARFANV